MTQSMTPSTTDVLIYRSTPSSPRLKRYTEVAIFLFGFLCLIVPSGYSYGAVLLFLGGVFVFIKDRNPPSLDRFDKYILAALLFFGVVDIFSWLWHEFDGDIDKSIRFLLAIPIFYLVYKARPSLCALWMGLAFGSLGSLFFAIYQRVYIGLDRAEGFSNAIQFGNLALLQGLLCLVGLGWAVSLSNHRRKYFFLLLLTTAALAGVATSILSGTRGGWIGLPVILCVIFFAYHRLLSIKSKLILLLALIIGGGYLIINPQLGVTQRIDDAVDEVVLFQKGEVNTSVGMRLEMWRGAHILIQEKPFLGWGKRGYQNAVKQLQSEERLHEGVSNFGHLHNDFIDRFVKQGILGLLAVSLLYFLPLMGFSKAYKTPDLTFKSVVLAGIILTLCYINFGLTQAFLRHNSGVMVYVTLLTVIAGYFKIQRLDKAQLKLDS